jgi:hypothetical protein
VRGKDESEAEVPVQLAHQINQLRRILGVEVRSRFIGQHKCRVVNNGPSHRNPLTLATRKQVGPMSGA